MSSVRGSIDLVFVWVVTYDSVFVIGPKMIGFGGGIEIVSVLCGWSKFT